jgi:tetratricopeptide (TPR) repeat protein
MRLAALPIVLGLALHVAPARAGDDVALERGVVEFEAGRFAAAIALLKVAHASDPSDLDTQLLLGIAYFRIDDVARARPFLLAAARSSDAETRDSAHIFLGLLADAAGDATAAHGYYDRVARSGGSLAQSGQQLLDRDRGERFAAIAVLRPEIDSNVPLLPTTAAPADGSTLDSDLFLLGDVSVRPIDGEGLTLDEAVSFRKQARLVDYDAAASVTSATWRERDETWRVALGYHFDASLLGGARYQVGHTADAAVRRAIEGPLGVALGYQLVARTLYPDAYAGYTGVTHTGTARLSWSAPALELEAGAVIARERTDDPTLAALARGGQLTARIHAGHADLRAFAQLTDRRYNGAALGRRDTHLRAEASLYVDLSSNVGGVIGGGLLHDVSNQMDLGYTKWTGYLGVVVATGL